MDPTDEADGPVFVQNQIPVLIRAVLVEASLSVKSFLTKFTFGIIRLKKKEKVIFGTEQKSIPIW